MHATLRFERSIGRNRGSFSAPKVRHFLWRLAHNSMPLKMNIKSRGIDLDTRGHVCMCFDQDGGTVFPKCKLAKGCWRLLEMGPIRQALLEARSTKEFVKNVLQLEQALACKVSILLWKCWEWDARKKRVSM
jgi:hypothetical protein